MNLSQFAKSMYFYGTLLMGKSKSTAFSDEQNQLAILAKAIAHPARIAILQFLMKQTSCVCGDIVHELPLAQATVSQHLKALKDAGIIQGEISGTSVCYCISNEGWQLLNNQFTVFFNQYHPSDSNCF